jgi:hypothetical protein
MLGDGVSERAQPCPQIGRIGPMLGRIETLSTGLIEAVHLPVDT